MFLLPAAQKVKEIDQEYASFIENGIQHLLNQQYVATPFRGIYQVKFCANNARIPCVQNPRNDRAAVTL